MLEERQSDFRYLIYSVKGICWIRGVWASSFGYAPIVGVSRFLKVEIGTCPAFRPQIDGQPTQNKYFLKDLTSNEQSQYLYVIFIEFFHSQHETVIPKIE
jgi:hypothetical protein